MARNYLVTGGAGFIGSNYVRRLIQRGEKVTIYDNLSRAGAPRNIGWLEETFGKDAFRLIVGDLRSADLITESAKEADIIVHLAGQVAVTTSVINPRDDFEANAVGTFDALEAARYRRGIQSLFMPPPIKCMAAWTMWSLSKKRHAGDTRIWSKAAPKHNRWIFILHMAVQRGPAINMSGITHVFTGCVRWSFARSAFMGHVNSAWRIRAGWHG